MCTVEEQYVRPVFRYLLAIASLILSIVISMPAIFTARLAEQRVQAIIELLPNAMKCYVYTASEDGPKVCIM